MYVYRDYAAPMMTAVVLASATIQVRFAGISLLPEIHRHVIVFLTQPMAAISTLPGTVSGCALMESLPAKVIQIRGYANVQSLQWIVISITMGLVLAAATIQVGLAGVSETHQYVIAYRRNRKAAVSLVAHVRVRVLTSPRSVG